MLGIVYGLKQIAADGLHVIPVLATAVGAVIGAMFISRQHRLADPFMDLRLFASRIFTVAAGALAIGIGVLWGLNYAIAQVLQLVYGLSPFEAGLWTAPSAIGVIVGSTLAPRAARKMPPTMVVGVGLGVSTIGYAALTQVNAVDGLALLVSGAVVVSLGLGPMMALATDMTISAAPPARTGAASAIASTAPQLGGALGIAILGSVITAVYRGNVAQVMSTNEISAVVSNSLNAAVAIADQLSVEQLAIARAAFTQGFNIATGISAILMAGTAALVFSLPKTPKDRSW